ncbi:MAG TPA: hypothetical protein VKY37_13230 [Brumimicrobium sp.]|nr:hypothetical protein [Brumimicrobium sp.]
MKKDEIPQDPSKLENKNMKELCYAIDENGEYSTGLSSGWEPKSIALDLTMDNLNQQIEEAKQDVLNGLKSPIVYFMLLSKMDVGVLSSYMGRSKWIIKRHFKPKNFKKLKKSTLEKYADVFEIDVNQILNFNE